MPIDSYLDADFLQSAFTLPLLNWFEKNGRKDLPWQHPRSAYAVWVSEIMLQQTQVQTVIPYFKRFMSSFPDVFHLAVAGEDEVLAHWSGLGYYSRARNLHQSAKIICNKWSGQFPEDPEILVTLPGIGASTAAAIASQAFGKPVAILDANVKRVLSRYFMVDGFPEATAVKKRLWQLANTCMPKQDCANYTQSIMDLGATCCKNKNPSCSLCPVQATCLAHRQDQVMLYPFKKPAKIKPCKEQQFLLLHTARQIYLEKRPPVGIWGGLWCLPGIEMDQDPLQYVSKQYALQSRTLVQLTELKHSFSHFHLLIQAMAIGIETRENSTRELAGRWFYPHELGSLGLAKPVHDILKCFLERQKGRLKV